MEPKYIKPAIAGGLVVILIVFLVMVDAGEKFGRLIKVGGQIATALANAPHGDPRSLDEMDKEKIKATTGSSNVVDVSELPKAFVPMKKYGHPPFTLGACNVCHASRTDKPAAITTRTVAELCYTCHYPKDDIDKRMAALDCNKCHSPHHADRKKLVRNKVTERDCPVGKFQSN
ncbi:MAG: cytochrome c3 family protein [Sulfurimonas sp.]|uniref:cytochrome c3 family protein n=1 Tax=Sulfurimonas sp. TaxID=2022749 RepID=UPI0026392D6A|nr:cytochrome c3 family protein [Sulfurimonas sp.]MCW8895595.1 cytochrome c3 family protein [Sulfurimonas sp.]MCW8954766.1 cytochrome c3 family protein [Sulfurimonas sp.]MCW9067598.1 cytochrome c3 family protein [Sulfurimonas sp.]